MSDLSSLIPHMEHFEKLVPVAARMYEHMDRVAQTALMPLFLLSILMAYSKDLGLAGAVVGRLKRLLVTALLLAAFPDLSSLIHRIGSELAFSVDNMDGIDAILKASAANAKGYSVSVTSLLEMGNDFILWSLVHASYVLLYVARLGLVAFYHFYWLFLVTVAPLLILGHLFEATASITQNLCKNVVIVSMWPVAWSILSCFLKALPYASAYEVEGGYTALVVMNLIIACALFFSPFLISSFCEGLLVGTGSVLYSASKAALAAVNPKLGAVAGFVASKAYPKYQRFVPSKFKSAVDWTFPKQEKPQSPVVQRIVINRPPTKTQGLLLLIASGVALTASASVRAQSVILHPAKAAVLCFEQAPRKAILGDAKFFRASRIGQKQLLLQGLQQGKSTNLIVLGKGDEIRNYSLVTDSKQLFLPKIDCQAATTGATIPAAPAKPRFRPLIANEHLRFVVTSIKWSGSAKDFLSLAFEIESKTGHTLRPHWSQIELVSAEKRNAHSKLWSSRKQIGPRAKIVGRIEFKKPELPAYPAVLRVPFGDFDLRMMLPKEALR
jgi:hypothetical protein